MPSGSLTADRLTALLKEEAHRLGFELAGVAPAASPPHFGQFLDWLARGHAGQMRYLAERAEARRHPQHVLEGARSILMLGMNYRTAEPVGPGPGQASVSRYAWGVDYHGLIRRRLRRLADVHRRLVPQARVRGVVDTAPLLERDFAQMAGLGWIGKNNTLITPDFGSWVFLAAMLTTEELDHDEPFVADRCGSCRACLDACPTRALVDARQLDARRCISYLTIELRDSIPEEFRPAIGGQLLGCDACQQVCPWNRRTPTTDEPGFQPGPGMNPVDLAELVSLDEAAFRERFRHTLLWRTRRGGLLRNAAIALGNQRHAT